MKVCKNIPYHESGYRIIVYIFEPTTNTTIDKISANVKNKRDMKELITKLKHYEINFKDYDWFD